MGSMREVRGLPDEVLNRLAIVLIKDGWEMWMLPGSISGDSDA